MKKSIFLLNRLSISVVLLLLIMSISNGCTKDSTDDTTNYNPSKSGGPGANEVWIQGMSFNPSSITVYVGTKITWTNKDAVTHDVTSNSTVFSSGPMTNGATFSYTFTTAGTFPYTCTIHPTMKGTVTVNEVPPTPGY